MKPFDGARFVLILLAFVIVCEMLMLASFLGVCIYWSGQMLANNFKCDPDNRIGEIFSLLLATIIALLNGRVPPSPPKE